MRNRNDVHLFVAAMLLIVIFPSLMAQEQPELKPLHFDLTPFIGYRTSMSFPIDSDVSGTNARIILDANPSYGLSFGFRLHEDDVIEMRWARQDSYVHSENISPQPPRQRVLLDQFHGDFSHEYLVEEMPQSAKPFVMASVGGTHLSGGSDINFTRFSFGIGGGIRFYATRHIGFKVQAEWVPVFVDPHAAFVCGAGCVVHVGVRSVLKARYSSDRCCDSDPSRRSNHCRETPDSFLLRKICLQVAREVR